MRWAALGLIGTGNADHGDPDSFLFFFLPTGEDVVYNEWMSDN